MLRKAGPIIHAASVCKATEIAIKALSSLQMRLLRFRDEKYLVQAKDDN